MLLLLPVLEIALSAALLKIRSVSFVWIWLTWAATFFGACIVLKTDWPRAILIQLLEVGRRRPDAGGRIQRIQSFEPLCVDRLVAFQLRKSLDGFPDLLLCEPQVI